LRNCTDTKNDKLKPYIFKRKSIRQGKTAFRKVFQRDMEKGITDHPVKFLPHGQSGALCASFAWFCAVLQACHYRQRPFHDFQNLADGIF
jgi:hypothetical protein